MTEAYGDWFALMEKLESILEQLTGLARETIEAAKKADLMAVNDCMKRQQVLSLSLRSMDIQREKIMGRLGLPGERLASVAGHAPPELRLRVKQTEERLRGRYEIYRAAAASARKLLESDLHIIETHTGQGTGRSNLADIRA